MHAVRRDSSRTQLRRLLGSVARMTPHCPWLHDHHMARTNPLDCYWADNKASRGHGNLGGGQQEPERQGDTSMLGWISTDWESIQRQAAEMPNRASLAPRGAIE